MLEKLNRCEVFVTYDADNLEKVKHMLDVEGMDYFVKTTMIHEVNDTSLDAKNYATFFYDYCISYKIFVNYNQADEAIRIVHQTLFPEE